MSFAAQKAIAFFNLFDIFRVKRAQYFSLRRFVKRQKSFARDGFIAHLVGRRDADQTEIVFDAFFQLS